MSVALRGKARRGWPPGYSSLFEIGRSSTSVVYRATHDVTGRQVALKVVSWHQLSPHAVEDYVARLPRVLDLSSHPNVVSVYAPLPEGRGAIGTVMELCAESYLQRARRSGHLKPEALVALGTKLCGALHATHRGGFVHGHLKPQNLLTTAFGEPALADFGIGFSRPADLVEGVGHAPALHTAPEVLEGSPVTPRSDLYSLMSVLYELLTGRAPFAAHPGEGPASVVLRAVSHDPPLLRAVDVPVTLVGLFDRCFSKKPEDRPADAATLARLLQGIAANEGWLPTSPVLGETLSENESGSPQDLAAARHLTQTPRVPDEGLEARGGQREQLRTPASTRNVMTPAVAGPDARPTATGAASADTDRQVGEASSTPTPSRAELTDQIGQMQRRRLTPPPPPPPGVPIRVSTKRPSAVGSDAFDSLHGQASSGENAKPADDQQANSAEQGEPSPELSEKSVAVSREMH